MAGVDRVVAHLLVAFEQIFKFEELPLPRSGRQVTRIDQQMRTCPMGIKKRLAARDAAGHPAGTATGIDVTARVAGVENGQ